MARTALLEQSRPRKRVLLDESCLEKFLLPASMLWWSLEGPQVSVYVWPRFPRVAFLLSGFPTVGVRGPWLSLSRRQREEWVCRVLGPCGPKGKTEWQACWGVGLTYTLCKIYGVTLNTRKNGELGASLISPK